MKENVNVKYLRRVCKVLETKLNDGNIIKGINTWAIPLLRYSTASINWNCAELIQLDQRIMNLMTIHNALHPKSKVDGLYIPKKEGGRGLQGVEETINMS